MKFKEFVLFENNETDSIAMDQLIDTALSVASTSPEAANATLRLMASLTDKVQHVVQDNVAQEPEVEPEQPPPAEPAPTVASEPVEEPETSPDELSESNTAEIDDIDKYIVQINALKGMVAGNTAALAEIDSLVDSFRKKIAAVQQQAHAAGIQAGREQKASEHASLDEYVELMLTRLPVQPNSKKMLIATIKSIFQEDHISNDDARVFLEAAASGSIIDMEKLLAAGSGNIRDFVRPELLNTFDKVIDDFFKLDLGSSTGGNIGPGEIAFILLGSPAKKVKKGDLEIGTEKFEVKSSGLKKAGKGKSGSVFGGDHISTAKALWPKVRNIIRSYGIKDTEETVNVDGKEKKSARYKLNSKGLAQYNAAFEDNYLGPESRANLLSEILLTLYPDIDSPKKLPAKIKKILKNNGGKLETNNNGEFMRLLTKLALEMYRKDESKENFIYFNQSSKNFHVYRGNELDDDLSNPAGSLEVMRGIDWNDGQYKASPGLYLK